MRKFTLGNWTARDERSKGGEFLIVRQAPGGGLLDTLHIAKVSIQGPETEGNAVLLAAGPVLLHSLGRLVQTMSNEKGLSDTACRDLEESRELIAQIRDIHISSCRNSDSSAGGSALMVSGEEMLKKLTEATLAMDAPISHAPAPKHLKGYVPGWNACRRKMLDVINQLKSSL